MEVTRTAAREGHRGRRSRRHTGALGALGHPGSCSRPLILLRLHNQPWPLSHAPDIRLVVHQPKRRLGYASVNVHSLRLVALRENMGSFKEEVTEAGLHAPHEITQVPAPQMQHKIFRCVYAENGKGRPSTYATANHWREMTDAWTARDIGQRNRAGPLLTSCTDPLRLRMDNRRFKLAVHTILRYKFAWLKCQG